MRNTLISIIGPTAIGKTSLSLELAKYFGTEIISADSRQFFKEMSIGTAVPDPQELSMVPHHFIQHISVTDSFSVGEFERSALQRIDHLFKSHEKLVMVGGSGLYVNAVLFGLDHFPAVDPSIRANLNHKLQTFGISPLQEKLRELDPIYFSEVDKDNPHRLVRALEICLGTGRTYSSFRNQNIAERPFKSILIGLTAERETIYSRINQRVDIMMEQGLLEEAKHLYPMRTLNALNTVGYKELFDYLEGNYTLEEAVSEIKKNTRRFAKRQLTWFKKNKDIHWFDFRTPSQEIIRHIEKISDLHK